MYPPRLLTTLILRKLFLLPAETRKKNCDVKFLANLIIVCNDWLLVCSEIWERCKVFVFENYHRYETNH